jgi:hypothetical protein
VASDDRPARRGLRLSGLDLNIVASEVLAGSRGPVERLTLATDLEGAGPTVVAKRRSLEQWSFTNLATEAAALTAIEAAGLDIAPRLLAGSAEEGVLVMTDLGTRTVESVLFGGDADEAEAALVALARATAELHQVPDSLLPTPRPATWTIGEHAIRWDGLVETVNDLGFPGADPASADAAQVIDALSTPGEAHVLVHGDLTPGNAVMGTDGRCRLIDFEGASRQHLGLDACALRFPFAWYGRWALVPPAVQQAMEREYRSAIGRSPADVDVAMATGCAAMAVLRLQRLPVIDDPDQSFELARRRRVQILSTVSVASAAAAEAGLFPDLVTWFNQLSVAMRERWEECQLPPPVFPAFS